jgi:hypothetical protein
VYVRTIADGTYTYERAMRGTVKAVEVKVGTLSTPDIAITDGVYGTAIYSGTGLSADAVTPVDVAVMGTLKVVVTGAGDTTKGQINVLVET